MPRKEGNKNLSVTMSESELEFVHKTAEERGYKVTADYVRALIEQDVQAYGGHFQFSIDRGGDRRPKSE